MSTASIEVAYDGPALANGTMDVRELAPALLAIGELCQDANKILNGDQAQVSINVKSDFESGSFHINLEVVQLLSQVKSFLLGDNVTAALQLTALLGFAGSTTVGLIKLVKWINGRQVSKVEPDEAGNITIHINNSTLTVSQSVVKLYNSGEIRKSLEGALKPLERDGIDEFQVKQRDVVLETITKEEYQHFKAKTADIEQALTEERRITHLEVIKPSFQENLKWTFSEGDGTVNADMGDKDFLDRLNRREIGFVKGDVLKVEMQTKTFHSVNGLRTERKILKVLLIIPAPRQIPLL